MKKLIAVLCVLSFMGGLQASSVHASGSRGLPQENYTRPSSPFDVGLMFHKLLGTTPSFDDWIKASNAYKRVPPNYQSTYLTQEAVKWRQKYESLDIDRSAVVIRAAINIEVARRPALLSGETTVNTLRLLLPENREIYFPYQIGDQMIAVIPNGLDLYREIPLMDTESKFIRHNIDPTGSVTLVLEIVPKMADGKSPITLDGVPQWPLIGEIGFLGLYNDKTEPLWTYQAANYIMQGQDTLLDLRLDRPPVNLNSLKPDPMEQ